MNVLVLVEDYPSNKKKTLMYVHVRNKYYVENGIQVTVLNFRAKENYTIDNINVITLEEYKRKSNNNNYDILI